MTVRDLVGTLVAAGDSWSRFGSQVDRSCRELLGRPAGVGELLLSLRDMPYARPSSVSDPEIILSEWRGTCSSKHVLLMRLLDLLGIEATLYMGAYHCRPVTCGLPPELIGRLRRPEEPFWDVHNYVRADLNGPLLIDLTWPAELSRYPFFRVTRVWDGQSDFRLAAEVGEERVITPDAGGIEAKKAWLEELNPTASARAAREDFIIELSKFIGNEIRAVSPEESIRATIAALADEERRVGPPVKVRREETSA